MDVSENNEDEDDSEEEVDHESDEEMDDGEDRDRLSEVSETYSTSTYRSRIPVPVAGSYGKHLVSW